MKGFKTWTDGTPAQLRKNCTQLSEGAYYELAKNHPTVGLIAKLAEHCTGIAEVMIMVRFQFKLDIIFSLLLGA